VARGPYAPQPIRLSRACTALCRSVVEQWACGMRCDRANRASSVAAGEPAMDVAEWIAVVPQALQRFVSRSGLPADPWDIQGRGARHTSPERTAINFSNRSTTAASNVEPDAWHSGL